MGQFPRSLFFAAPSQKSECQWDQPWIRFHSFHFFQWFLILRIQWGGIFRENCTKIGFFRAKERAPPQDKNLWKTFGIQIGNFPPFFLAYPPFSLFYASHATVHMSCGGRLEISQLLSSKLWFQAHLKSIYIYRLERIDGATPIRLGLSWPLTNRHQTWEWLAIDPFTTV